MFTPSTNPNPTKLFYSLALLYSLPVMFQHLGFRFAVRGKSFGVSSHMSTVRWSR
jgi:alginate O-acetyltransferase complex protein AlgI